MQLCQGRNGWLAVSFAFEEIKNIPPLRLIFLHRVENSFYHRAILPFHRLPLQAGRNLLLAGVIGPQKLPLYLLEEISRSSIMNKIIKESKRYVELMISSLQFLRQELLVLGAYFGIYYFSIQREYLDAGHHLLRAPGCFRAAEHAHKARGHSLLQVEQQIVIRRIQLEALFHF